MTSQTHPAWRVAHKRSLPLDGGPLIMGIVNVTPDSFSDGGMFYEIEAAVSHALSLAKAGADILDIGGESSRPGAEPVSPAEQIKRIRPVVRRLAEYCGDVISIDTRSAEVAEAALEAGAHIINDISALGDDPGLAEVVRKRGAGVVLMHMKGVPADMQDNPTYDDVAAEVRQFLAERIEFALAAGLEPQRIVIDPGIGFGKTLQHNLELLGRLDELVSLGYPVLVGPSRKKFIGDLLGVPVNERLAGSLGACVMAVAAGASVIRVHAPGPVSQAISIAHAIMKAKRT